MNSKTGESKGEGSRNMDKAEKAEKGPGINRTQKQKHHDWVMGQSEGGVHLHTELQHGWVYSETCCQFLEDTYFSQQFKKSESFKKAKFFVSAHGFTFSTVCLESLKDEKIITLALLNETLLKSVIVKIQTY